MADLQQATKYVDIFDKCDTDAGYFGPQRAAGDEYFTRPVLPPTPDRIMEFQGQKRTMWSVNNYLGLADHPEVKEVALEAVREFGVSAPMGSRMMSGNTEYHLALEEQLAEFAEKQAAFLFNYGYLGVQGTIASLAGPDDVLVMDKLAHACIVDGAFGSQAQVRVFKHNNMESLETVLKRVNRDRKGGVMILTEGVYGMTGDLAKLREITELKERYDARLYIDDAHGCGVMGAEGRGTADHFGVQDKVDIYFGTFAKAFASIGGFSATTKPVRDWIMYNARTQVFAKSLPMVYVKSLGKTLELVRGADGNRQQMWDISYSLKQGLRDLGYYVGPGESPICAVFVPIGTEESATVGMRLVRYLRDRGIFVTAITYPVIPLGLLMFRVIPTAAHKQEDVEVTLEEFRRMRDEMGLTLDMSGEDEAKVRKVFGL
ncbi:MAG: aminotransferase class I/II-fold pyridoxal phosphate-dependent enzyme [Spirochaetaceae bacterium]